MANSRLLAKRYVAYVEAAQGWADALGCEAEEVEYMLFRRPWDD